MSKEERKYEIRRRSIIRQSVKMGYSDILLVTDSIDVRYLSGCVEGGAALLVCRDFSAIFTNKMFEHVVPKQAPGVDVYVCKEPLFKETTKVLNKHKLRRAVGFQGNNMPWAHYANLSKAMGRRKLINIGDLLVNFRAVKDADEIKLTGKCVKIAEKAYLEVMAKGAKALMLLSERQIAAELEYRMRMLGADKQGFDGNGIIVATGPNSASCHHVPSARKVKHGEPILIDWGAELNGYRSDITRVMTLGEPSAKFREIYNIVTLANLAGVKAVKSGVTCDKVAAIAWGEVRDAGYGDYIRHGLGHGLGLMIHEQPFIGNGVGKKNSKKRLRKNMIITIEPGIYIEGVGGVRIEDDVVVTVSGSRCLTSLPRHLDQMILR